MAIWLRTYRPKKFKKRGRKKIRLVPCLMQGLAGWNYQLSKTIIQQHWQDILPVSSKQSLNELWVGPKQSTWVKSFLSEVPLLPETWELSLHMLWDYFTSSMLNIWLIWIRSQGHNKKLKVSPHMFNTDNATQPTGTFLWGAWGHSAGRTGVPD